MNYLRNRTLSAAAAELIQFDADSIRRMGGDPDVWLVDPDQYERNGRLLRDSETLRMVAYSTRDHVLYATDGCNSCRRQAPGGLQTLRPETIKEFAEANELHLELLEGLVELIPPEKSL